MSWMRITMDGTTYRVRVVYNTLMREFELIEGPAAGYMLNMRHERDLIGTGISYEMGIAPDPDYPDDYDNFWMAISAPVDSHEITMPYNNTTITYNAEIMSGRDTYDGLLSGRRQWTGLVVRYHYIQPQREASP